MKNILMVFVFLALGTVAWAETAPGACQALHQEIEDALVQSNYCAQDSDCDTLELGGQLVKFGCYHFVNKAVDKDALYVKMRTYYGQCEQVINDCAQSPQPVCVETRCVSSEATEFHATPYFVNSKAVFSK